MPVSVTPSMKYFWAAKKTRITGTVISRLAAMVIVGLFDTCTENAYKPNARG